MQKTAHSFSLGAVIKSTLRALSWAATILSLQWDFSFNMMTMGVCTKRNYINAYEFNSSYFLSIVEKDSPIARAGVDSNRWAGGTGA